jgi:L-amino acid N-acyltransferase YncA
MITAQVENWSDCLPELKTLFPIHFKELALNQDKVELAPRYDVYSKMEKEGSLFVCTLRSFGVLIGYFVGIINPSLHYGNCLECSMDIFFVKPECRVGNCGMKLFKAVRHELKRRGVQRWHVGSKVHSDASALFRRLGMTQVETYYSEWLGD